MKDNEVKVSGNVGLIITRMHSASGTRYARKRGIKAAKRKRLRDAANELLDALSDVLGKDALMLADDFPDDWPDDDDFDACVAISKDFKG